MMNDIRHYFTIEPIDEMHKINLGLSNDHYLINQKYILRVPKEPNRPDLHIEDEVSIEKVASECLHPSIPIICFDIKKSLKITPFISGFTHFQKETATYDNYHNIAQLLKTLHHLNVTNLSQFDGVKRLYLYKQYSSFVPHPQENIIISNYQKHLSKDFVPCHHDLVSGNILLFKDHIEIIDFEYAGYDDPFFDIASFISENNIDDTQIISYFLTSYLEYQPTHETYQKLEAFLQFNDLLWLYWANMMFELYHEDIYQDIAKEKAEHLSAPLHLL